MNNKMPDTARTEPAADTSADTSADTTTTQPRNALHGLTLESIVLALAQAYGWDGLAERIPLRCFAVDPSLNSSLKFLRKTPWARQKVESLYLFMLRDEKRAALRWVEP